MKNHITGYKGKLEKAIGDYMDLPVSERSAGAVKGMMECWLCIDGMDHKATAPVLSREDAEKWAAHLINHDAMYPGDGSHGPKWPMETTTAVAKENGVAFDHVHDYEWWVAMNMMYSDYCKTAEKFGVATPEFFADLTRDFLFDPDGPDPREKLAAYYHSIVCPHK